MVTAQTGRNKQVYRSCISWLLVGIIGLINATQAVGGEECRPALAFKKVNFSEMKPPAPERKWTAIVSVETSRHVAPSAGHFEIVFTRLKET